MYTAGNKAEQIEEKKRYIAQLEASVARDAKEAPSDDPLEMWYRKNRLNTLKRWKRKLGRLERQVRVCKKRISHELLRTNSHR